MMRVSKGFFVGSALVLLGGCGRRDAGGEAPRVHYLLDEGRPVAAMAVSRPAAVAAGSLPGPAAVSGSRMSRAAPEPDPGLVAVQENDMAAEQARENVADDDAAADGAALNYAIGPVIGN